MNFGDFCIAPILNSISCFHWWLSATDAVSLRNQVLQILYFLAPTDAILIMRASKCFDVKPMWKSNVSFFARRIVGSVKRKHRWNEQRSLRIWRMEFGMLNNFDGHQTRTAKRALFQEVIFRFSFCGMCCLPLPPSKGVDRIWNWNTPYSQRCISTSNESELYRAINFHSYLQITV